MKTTILTSTDENLKICAKEILNSNIVAIPTETVYGLAANAFDEAAIKKIFEIKGRPMDNPLIVHISSLIQLESLVDEVIPLAKKLMDKFWPGPLTIVMKKKGDLNNTVTAGLDTVAVRYPTHPVALGLINKCKVPLAAPSANVSGKPSPTKAAHVLNDLDGRIKYILDGNDCEVGIESTVVTINDEKIIILRPGIITKTQLEEICDDVSIYHSTNEEKPISPGMKYKHYSPKCKVILCQGTYQMFNIFISKNKDKNIAALIFDTDEEIYDVPFITYGNEDDSKSQAKKLFDALRKTDELNVNVVYCRMPCKDDVGFAVFNRLIRAAGFEVLEL